DISAAVSSFRLYIVEILRIGRERSLVLNVVDRVAKRIFQVNTEARDKAALEGNLQAIVGTQAFVPLQRDIPKCRVWTQACCRIYIINPIFAPQIHSVVSQIGYLEGH